MDPYVKEQATKLAHKIVQAASAIAEQFRLAAQDGVDPNDLRDSARDVLVSLGLAPIQAANVVRLAVHKANRAQGVVTYSRDELRIICARIAGAQ